MTEEETKEFWLSNNRYLFIVIVLFILWGGVMLLFYLKADEVTKNPCQICAKKMGEEVTCRTMTSDGTITFYPNFTIKNDRTYILQ